MTETLALWLFWIGGAGVVYPYAGYPLVLQLLRVFLRAPRHPASGTVSTVTVILPVHNEARRLERKIANTLALDYPADRMEIIVVSDGSTDETVPLVQSCSDGRVRLIVLPARSGKAAALNAALAQASGEIVVFTDASIVLAPSSLRALIGPFADPRVGCVSGEDRIADGGGEGLYGRYELYLRRLESDVHSIVGASGSFYAQRRTLCSPFIEGMAPDFLSVLRTLQQGYRAISEPDAVGEMTSLKDPKHEFDRKVRTLVRGMTALFAYKRLLNPFRYGLVALELWSHKILRWTVPFFLLATIMAPLWLLDRPFYLVLFMVQVIFYTGAAAAFTEIAQIHHSLPGRIALYFSSVNGAILAAWYRYGCGERQELWTPSQR